MLNSTISAESVTNKRKSIPNDGFIDKYLNRKISSFITALLIRTPVSANQVTIFNSFIGLSSIFFFMNGSYYNILIGAVIFQVNTIVDHCDGEIARQKNQSSRFGFWLDVTTDAIVSTVVVISAGIGISTYLNEPSYIVWGAMAGCGILVSSLLVFYNAVKRDSDKDSLCFAITENGKEPTKLDAFVDGTLNKNLSFYFLLSAFTGMLHLLLIIAAIGVQVHCMLILVAVYKKRWSKN